MPKFRVAVDMIATSAAQAAADLYAMSRAASNKSVLVESIEGWEGN
jgi:hypothetical protein